VVTGTPTGARIDPEVVEATERVGRLLEAAGHRVVAVDPPVDAGFEDDFLLYWSVLAAGIRLVGLQLVGRSFDPDLLDPFTRGLAANLRRHGHRVPAALARLRRLRADVAAAQHAAGVDVVVTPVVATPPPPIGHLDVSLPYDTHIERVKQFVQFTPVQNVTGAPAVSVPAAVHSDGTPIGVQVTGLPGADRDLIELAHTLEEAIGWNGLAPAYR
jgi:amidase